MILNLCALWSIALKFAPLSNLFGVQVDFRIFYPNNPQYTQFNALSYDAITFDPTKKYVILTHGWIAGFSVDWYAETIARFSSHEDTIVIAAGYQEAMDCKLYVGSVLLLNALGDRVGNLLLHMHAMGVQPSQIEMAGHSLGAHVAGIAAKKVFAKTGTKVRRIFGLDPAGILIPNLAINRGSRLTKGDAERVIVIHTSLLGTQAAIGDADFYPNGGINQGACGQQYESDHVVSTMYFFCSINDDCTNIGYICNSYTSFQNGACSTNGQALMGYHIADSAAGTYYLNVNC